MISEDEQNIVYSTRPILLSLCSPFSLSFPGVEGGFDVEQEQYEEEVKVVLFPDKQEVTLEDLTNMLDVVRERVRPAG